MSAQYIRDRRRFNLETTYQPAASEARTRYNGLRSFPFILLNTYDMNDITKMIVGGALAAVLGFTGASIATAQETSASVGAEAEAGATVTGPQPLIQLREEARTKLQDLRQNMQDQRIDLRIQMNAATSSNERRDIIEEMRENREEARSDRQDAIGSLKARVQALARTHIGSAIQRAENALNMFDNVVDRMESRIEKLRKAGIETATAEASLDASVKLVAKANADLAALKSAVDSVRDSSDAETVRIQIRAAIGQVTASVKAAHASLLETARVLAGISANASADITTN